MVICYSSPRMLILHHSLIIISLSDFGQVTSSGLEVLWSRGETEHGLALSPWVMEMVGLEPWLREHWNENSKDGLLSAQECGCGVIILVLWARKPKLQVIEFLSYGNTVSEWQNQGEPGPLASQAWVLSTALWLPIFAWPTASQRCNKWGGHTPLNVLEQRSLLDGAWRVGPFSCNKSSPLKSVSEIKGERFLSVVWLFSSLWFMTRPCSLINFNANSVWRDLWPSSTKNELSYSLAWSCSEAKAECFIFQTADFLFSRSFPENRNKGEALKNDPELPGGWVLFGIWRIKTEQVEKVTQESLRAVKTKAPDQSVLEATSTCVSWSLTRAA